MNGGKKGEGGGRKVRGTDGGWMNRIKLAGWMDKW